MATILLHFDKQDISDSEVSQVQQLAPDHQVLVTNDPHELEEYAEDIEIAAGWVPPQMLLNLPNLGWYQQWAAGADWLIPHPKVVEKDFILTNGSGIHAICIAEQIFSYLLAFARNIPAAYRAQIEGVWQPSRGESLFELAGKIMVLVGLGDIGARTAQVALAFDLKVIGVDRNALVPVFGLEKIVTPDQLHDVLPEADFVVMTIPHTPASTGMIGKAEFDLMKSSAYFINIGRGKNVKEADMIDALQSGSIAGAGLDVFETEPLPADSPLWGMENVIATAHYAGATPVYQERAMAIFFENLRRYQAGETLHNIVSKELGY